MGAADWARRDPPFDVSQVRYAMGNMYKIVFLARLEGEKAFMPYQFDVASETWEPFNRALWDYGTGSDGPADWLSRCAGCHTTGFDPKTDTFAELSIGCEACHGPGAEHAASGSKEDILNPAALTGEEGDYVCARCHSHGIDTSSRRPYPESGTPAAQIPESFSFSRPVEGRNDSVFWGNGLARGHHAQFNELRLSRHFREDIRCFDCHDMHRYRVVSAPNDTRLQAETERFLSRRRTQGVCVRCHYDHDSEIITTEDGRLLDRHTMHPLAVDMARLTKASTGGKRAQRKRMRCRDCHMPKVHTETAGYQTSTHSFRIVDPADTMEYGVPNSCNVCHADRDASWASRQISDWRKTRPQRVP